MEFKKKKKTLPKGKDREEQVRWGWGGGGEAELLPGEAGKREKEREKPSRGLSFPFRHWRAYKLISPILGVGDC